MTAGGSGFVVSEDGYILTNNHVVENASSLRVYFPNREYVDAEFIGGDPLTDVAVIRIPEASVAGTLSFGDSDEVDVGEWVLAIGNPGIGGGDALDYSVTAGIISARGRNLNLLQRDLQGRSTPNGDPLGGFAIEDFIQTDAVINPGNSGGPMVDMSGRVVGINSAIASRTGYYQGYGFAIPINLAQRVMEDLIEFGQVRRPQIGVNIREVAPEDAEYYGLPAVEGAFVSGVTEGGPADQAGIREEDVIVAIEGEPIAAFNELKDVVEGSNGRPLDLKVWREGEVLDFVLSPRRVDEPSDEGGFETNWRIGIAGGLAFDLATERKGPFAALGDGVTQTWAVITSSLDGLYHMITGAISSCNMSGPIGIAEVSGAMASQGIDSFIWFIAVLSTAVGLLNLFPIPVLDGGHLMFYAYEAVSGRPPSDRFLRVLMTAGLVLVLSVMLFALFNDIFCP